MQVAQGLKISNIKPIKDIPVGSLIYPVVFTGYEPDESPQEWSSKKDGQVFKVYKKCFENGTVRVLKQENSLETLRWLGESDSSLYHYCLDDGKGKERLDTLRNFEKECEGIKSLIVDQLKDLGLLKKGEGLNSRIGDKLHIKTFEDVDNQKMTIKLYHSGIMESLASIPVYFNLPEQDIFIVAKNIKDIVKLECKNNSSYYNTFYK